MQVYSSIKKLPISRYFEVLENKRLDALIYQDNKLMIESEKQKLLVSAWDNIETEMLQLSLKDRKYKSKLAEEKRYLMKMINAHINPTAHQKTIYTIEKEKRENQPKSNLDLYTSMVHISKFMGYRMNPEEVTVIEYFTTIKLMGNGN